MDCEKLSVNALKIFEQIKAHYPPNPWGSPCWQEEGLVQDYSNTTWYDLRKSEDRNKLAEQYTSAVGRSVLLTASIFRREKKELRPCDINLKMCERWLELVCLIEELDFQIETMDLVDM